jgi:hypothetical protein
MIQPGFLDAESRRDLIELARDGSVPHRLARRANALVLLDQGMSCGDVAKVLFLDDDTIRTWYRLYQQDGFDGLVSFGYDGSACRLSDTQQDKLKLSRAGEDVCSPSAGVNCARRISSPPPAIWAASRMPR